MNPWFQKISLMAPKLLSLIQRFLGLNLEIQLPPRYPQGNLVPHVTKTVSSILTDLMPGHCLDILTLSHPNDNQVVILNFFPSHLPVPLLINVKSFNSSNPTIPLHGHCPT